MNLFNLSLSGVVEKCSFWVKITQLFWELILYLSGQNEMGANKTKAFRKNKQQKNTFGAIIKSMWEEQFVVSPIDYTTGGY